MDIDLSPLVDLFSWRVALDVALIGLLIFYLYRSLKTMGSWKIVVGLLSAFVVFSLARLLELRGVAWLLSHLSGVALIGLIVLFAPEIRRLLERAVSLRRGQSDPADSRTATMLAESLYALARQHRGALLVLPGKESIANWTTRGITADAVPTLPLLLSIFDPHSPGHDGAAIVDNGRVTHFAVHLPLSKSRELPATLGTRHHAALGLSEVSDALVIAVSEERGVVSAFHAGGMTRVDEPAELSRRILDHWRDSARYGVVPARAPRRRLAVQLAASLLAAALLWSTVVTPETETLQTAYSLPVEYHVPRGLSLAGDPPEEVRVEVAGPAADLARVDPRQIHVRLDLGQAEPGRQSVLVDEDDVLLPPGLRLVSVQPRSLDVTLEEVALHEVPVEPQLIGSLPNGAQLEDVQVQPEQVRVLASASNAAEISLRTTPIYLSNISGDVSVRSKVIAPPGVEPADGDWPLVEVIVRVRPGTSG
jgi:uncharacterized protein (TIGR00159 family)